MILCFGSWILVLWILDPCALDPGSKDPCASDAGFVRYCKSDMIWTGKWKTIWGKTCWMSLQRWVNRTESTLFLREYSCVFVSLLWWPPSSWSLVCCCKSGWCGTPLLHALLLDPLLRLKILSLSEETLPYSTFSTEVLGNICLVCKFCWCSNTLVLYLSFDCVAVNFSLWVLLMKFDVEN